ncbi:pericentrin isoform X4 [Notamacropus eugenii]|uniref:pericentrin isoform X4 n=1 Tax=Notamacropus eugenii TaxID=9315 RepID=UPI003B685236
MEYDEQEERRRKVEAGRAKLAQFRQRKTKGDSSSSKKKASKRKSTAVHAAVTEKEEECTVTPPDLEQSVDSRGDGDCAEGRASALEAKAETELSNLGTQKKPLTELAGQEQIFKDGRSSLTTDPSEPEVPSTQGKMKTLEERLESEQDDLDLLSQEVDEFQAQQAQCSGAAQVQQELEAAVQERDQIIVRLTSTLQRERQNHEYDQQEVLLLTNQMHALQHQLRENSELLKNKMPARGGSSWPQSLAAAPLQCPPELHPPQQNIEDKENTFAQMEDLLKSTIQEPSQVVEEEEGLISGHQEQLSLDEDIVSLPGVLLGKDLEIREFKQGEQDCVEKFQAHPQKEAWRPLQDRRWDMLEEKPESGMTDVRKACGDAVNGKYREASGPTRPGVPPVAGLRERQPPGLGGVNINLKDQLQESDPCRESQRAAFQKERGETEQMEKSVLEGFQEKLPFVETHSEQAWDSKGDQGNWGEETQKLSSGVQGLNGLVLQVPEKSRGLQLECIEDITTGDREPRQLEQEEIGSLGGVDAQKAELKRMQSKLCLPLAEPLHCELEHQTVLQRCNLESEEDQSSKIDLSEDDPVIEPGTMDGETSVEGLMMEGAGDLMEKYLVCTEREDHSNASDTAEYFDIETALQSKSERESQDFIADELIIGFSEKMDLNVLSVGNSAKVESLADSVTNTHFSSDLSQGDLSEIYRLMDKDKVYLMQRCVKFNQLLREKELTFRNFSPETEETEERLWEGRHRLPFGPHLERGSSLSCNEIFSSLEEEGENQIEPGAATGSTTDLQGSFSVAPQTLPWPGMAKVFQKEVERQVGKLASDLMHLEALRCQEEDRLQDQLGAHKARSQVSAGHPGQKTTLEKTLLQKLETLKAEIALKENLLTQIVKEKDNLEKSFSKGQENLEENILELTEKIKCLAKGQEHEKREFSGQSECGPSEVQKLDAEVKAKESDFMQAENNPIEPTVSLRNAQEEPEWWLLGGMRKAAWALEDIPSELSSHYEKQIHQMKHQHEAERAQLRREHQKEVEDISEQMKAKLAQQQQRWNEERKEQIGVIKKIHEREHDREIAELICKHKDEMKQLQDGLQNKHQQMMDELQQHLGALHETELQQAQLQAQTLHSLELEALRLSLSNLHTAQLELTQANLHKEKETALVELREMLNDKRAQEVALVQSRQQYELEHIKEQHRKETEEMTSKHQQDLADLEKKLELEKELHAQMLEKLKGDWDLERGLCLRRLEEELAQKHQAEVEGVREALRAQLANQKAELEKMGQDKAQAEAALRSEQAQHRVALQDLRQELQLQHDQYLEDMNLKFREKQQKLDSLQASYEELQAQSREEIQQLWSQLDSTRANRQELNELKEQLLARASHVEQMEHLKHDFEEQQQRRRSEHESELEQLRLYFEQKLRAAEESYREDLYLLHQRLQEVREDSFLDSADVSWSIGFVEEDSEVERKAHLEQLMLQLEQHKEGIAHLRLQLEEKHRDELDALKASLETDHKEKHVAEMERERRQHCRDLEELRAHLTEEHRKEIIKVRLQCAQDAARQVEAEVAERVSLVLEEDRCKVAQLQANEGLISRLKEEVSLARTENAELQEKLQCEICLKEEAEKMRCHLVEDHQKEINKMREEIEQMICKDRDKEEDWHGRCRDLSRKAEERLATLARELNGKAQQEQQALSKSFDLHIMEMKQLQDQQEADIARLEQSLRQRDESRAEEEAAWQAQATQDLEAAKAQMTRELELATRRLQEDCALKLQTSRERFLEEQKETTQKLTERQDALFRQLQDKHASELQMQSDQLQERLRQQIESLTIELQTQHQEEMDTLRASLQSQHQAQLDAHMAELQTQHQEEMDTLRASLQSQHQARLDARVAELQTQHQEEVDTLRASLESQHQAQLDARVAELQTQHQEEVDTLRASLQSQHQAQLDARVAELQTQHQEEVDTLRASLQSQHQAQLDARVAELETQHQEEVDALRASLQSQHQAQLDARVTELQTQHAAEISVLEAKHLSNLDSLESCYLSEIQTMQGEQSHALESLQVRLEEQLRVKEAEHQVLMAQETEKHKQEQQLAQENLRIEMTANHIEKLKTLAAELQDAHQEELQAALHSQRCFLEEENHKALDRLSAEVLSMEAQHRQALQELKDIHVAELEKQRAEAAQQLQEELGRLRAEWERDHKDELEMEKRAAGRQAEEREKAQALCQREKEALTSQLQEQSSLIVQLKEKVLSLSNEVAETHGELEKLQERREREHEEGTNLISLLRSDMDHTQHERKTLQETNQRLLSLFGDTLKAAIAMKSQISKRIGIYLDEDFLGKESTPMEMREQPAQDMCQLPGDTSPQRSIPPLEFDQTLPECDETLLAATDISSHVRESFFWSPGVTVECEQPIRRIYQSLGAAVDNLLEMMLDSSKQLEETRELHARFEKEFHRKNEETAQAVRQYQELMDCLNQESAAKNQLALELHKAEGLAEGYRAEKVALEEALMQKEKSEHHLAVEVENLRGQLQSLTQEQARLMEEQGLLLRQKETLIVEAEEKATGLLKEVEHLIKEQSEAKQQSEKDCSTLRSQMRTLELELEDQLSHNQELAQQAAEIQDLKQQIVSLDKHLRNQRQFMDEQAVEREHERDDFQQEIRKLEERLKQQPPAKSQLWGEYRDSESLALITEVESLQRKLREKIDELNELAIKKELAERQLTAQKEEIRNLTDTNTEIRRTVSCLEEELEKQKKIGKELRQDKEALQEQQMNNLIQISTLQSKLDEAKHVTPSPGSSNEEDLKEKLEAEQAAVLMKEREVLGLKEELEQLKITLTTKSDELLQLNLELALQNSQLSASVQELSSENADFKALLQSKEKEIASLNEQIKGLRHEVIKDRSSEIEELKTVIENLHENQERLRTENMDEVERLHEVIEKLQQELSLLGPTIHEVSDSQGDSDGSQAENLQQELQRGLFSLQTADTGDDARKLAPDPRVKLLQHTLEEKENQFRLHVEVLERDLQRVRAASTEQLGLLTHQLSLKEAEAKRTALHAQHWKAAFLQKEAEVGALTQEKGTCLAELEILEAACSHLQRELKRQQASVSQEPPELQMLRAQCVGLNLKLQALSQKLVTYQTALDQHQACGLKCRGKIQKHLREADAVSPPKTRGPGQLQSGSHAQEAHWSNWVSTGGPRAPATTEEESGRDAGLWRLAAATQRQCGDGLSLVEEQSFSTKDLAICREAGLQRKENVISILTVCQKHLESELIFMKNKIELSKKDSSQIQQKPMESYQLHKEDLIIQVRHIQEKLHHLIKSVSRGDSRDAEGWTQLSPQGPSEQPMVASPPQRPHRCVSRTAQGQSPADPRPPASQGPDPNILCLSWDSPDNTKSYDPPGHVRHKFKLEQSLDSFPSSPSGDLYDADPLTSDCSCFEERAPPLMKSQDTPPADGGKFPLEPSEESAHGSPSSACSAENGSQDAEPLDTIQHFRDTILDMETSSLGSPELVRKDSTLEGLPSIHLTPLSQAVDLQSPDLAWQSLALQDSSGYLGYTALPGLGEAPPASQSPCYRKKSQPDASRDIRRRILEKDGEDFIITLTDSQADLQSKVPDLGTDNKGRDASSISDFPDKLKQNSERRRPPHTHLVARLQKSGMVQRPFKPMKEKLEMQSKQMKALLKMVCDESQQILVLSKAEASGPELGSDPLHTPLDCFQKERQGLLDAVQALKDHLTKVPPRSEEKEPLDAGFDWGDFLQAVQEVLEKERNVLKMELQSKLCNLESGDERSLLEKLEDVVKEQGELQKRTLENLHLSDRSSLLSEIQALRAQLRMTHLQNQEKLQQLYEALTNVEDHGSKQEYQFRRQIELLEYKVEQERCLVSDLQKTLTEEQEKGTENQKLLLAAQNATQELKSELEECKHEKETLAQSLRDAQKEAAHLRSMLENKEQDLQAALDMLQGEKQKAKELQALVEEEQRQSVEKEELSSKAIEELQASLDKQRSQNGQLAISLQHEQAEKDNLKKELQIEYSRCEALLCQERSQVCELQRALEAERSHSVELSEALSHERLVTEQLSKRAGEACTQKEAQLQHAFMRKLKEEKARAAELQALLADARQQGMASQKQLELEVHMHQEELKKEKEVSALLQASADALHTQKQELLFYLEEERAKQGKLQSELELFQTRLKEEASKETKREKEKRHEAQAEEDQGKKDKERLGWQRELELQRQRDEHKIQQLQQTIIQLEKDKGFMPSRAWQECGAGAALPPAMEKLQGHHDQLENVRQQLLHAVSLLTSFMNQTVNRTINDWTSSNEKAVMSLLLTLEELKSELMSGLPQKKNAQAQISLLDVLLKENGSLTKALSTMTQEKLELCRTVAKLEKTLKHHLQKGCGHIYKYVDCVGMLQKADKAAWKQQKMALQGSRHGESGMVKAAFKSEASHGGNTCRIRMEKLYLHFLRAESFRKALVYQKRYLLLLIGGFQDSEQETLSMIAHLGVFPSKMDKRAFSSRPFTKFRTAVRVVIAILRLRFLVKKWQELDRRGTLAQSSELDSVPEEAMEISRQPPPQPLSSSPSLPETTSSPPTQDLPVSSIKSRHSPSPTYRVWDRALTSPSSSADVYDSSQDPEHSLTEYIHHLEVIQQRLGGVQPELSSKKPGHQKTKKMNP